MAVQKISLRYKGSSFALGDILYPITDYNYLVNRPSTFPPTGHQHNASDINAGVLGVDRIPELGQSKITNLVNDLAAKALKEQGVYFVQGNTSGTAGTWTGSIPGLTSYYDGLTIRFRIGIAGASTTTLNINGLGAVTVQRYVGSSNITTHFPVNSVITMTKVGSSWVVQDWYDSTDDYGLRWQNSITFGAYTHGYQILLEGVDGKFYPVTEGGSTGNTNVVSTAAIKPGGKVVYYASSSDVAANASGGAYYIYESHYNGEMEYWNNRDNGWATAYRPFFFVFTQNADGSLKLDNTSYTSFMTQTLPTTDDGKLYMQVGIMNDTSESFRLLIDHPIYQYKDGKLRLWVPPHTHVKADITDFAHTHVKADITDFPTSMPASDVYAWAKAANKPSYNLDEISEGATYKLVTQAEKNDWALKADQDDIDTSISYFDTTIVTPGLAGKVPTSRLIAGINLVDDITIAELTAALNVATTSLKGVMSATDKARLDTLYALLNDSTDGSADSIVDTIQDILAIFSTYPEGADMVTALAGKVNTTDVDENATASKIAKRNSSGDILARLFRSEYATLSTTPTYIMVQHALGAGADNYIRPLALSQLKTSLGSMPASDVYSWAKQANKPTYNASEVGALGATAKAVDSEKLDGFDSLEVGERGSGSDFADGILVTTTIDATADSGASWIIEVTGKGYGQTPFNFIAEGYNYSATFINVAGYNYGAPLSYIKVLKYSDGKLAFWWPRTGYWNSFSVKVTDTTQVGFRKNYATNITNSTEPSSTKKVTINLVRVIFEGDSRLTDSRPASDVYSWAKQASKPSYAFSEIGSKPNTLSGYGITDGMSTSHYANNLNYLSIPLGSGLADGFSYNDSTKVLSLKRGTATHEVVDTGNLALVANSAGIATLTDLDDYVLKTTTINGQQISTGITIGFDIDGSLATRTSLGTSTVSSMANYSMFYVTVEVEWADGIFNGSGFIWKGIAKPLTFSMYDTSAGAMAYLQVDLDGTSFVVSSGSAGMPINMMTSLSALNVVLYGIDLVP